MDPHVSAVHESIDLLGGKGFIFDRYSHADRLTIRPNLFPDIKFITAEGEIHSSEIDAVWWRLKPVKVWSPGNEEQDLAAEFAGSEWRAVLFSLPFILSECRWLNPFPAHMTAAYKPLQLQIAKRLGFKIPETVFSNDPADIRDVVSTRGRSVYKQLSNFMFPASDFIFTNEITTVTLDGSDGELIVAPGIYQNLIKKTAELRVTVVGNVLFPIRIESQKNFATELDWRRSQLEDMYSLDSLSEPTSKLILSLMRELGISYGALDFIEDEHGDLVFLECNPGGQWLWLEELTDTKISLQVASFLLGMAE